MAAMLILRLYTKVQRRLRRWRGETRDYRDFLFEHLERYLAGRTPRSVLEIGPRDGDDTARLARLGPDRLVLAELPHAQEQLEAKLRERGLLDRVELVWGNIMYDRQAAERAPYDLIWCTGVLYHNPEQLRMIVRLRDWLAPDGVLVLESATARRALNRNRKVVEIWHNEPRSDHVTNHISPNVTHLPSRKAIAAWLEMAGFEAIELSDCHRRQAWNLARNRAAFVCRRPAAIQGGTYYRKVEEHYPIGETL
jgi:SAM-dependent methyltransferase